MLPKVSSDYMPGVIDAFNERGGVDALNSRWNGDETVVEAIHERICLIVGLAAISARLGGHLPDEQLPWPESVSQNQLVEKHADGSGCVFGVPDG